MGAISIIRSFQLGCPQEYFVREGCGITRSVKSVTVNLIDSFSGCFYGKNITIGLSDVIGEQEIDMCLLSKLTEFNQLLIVPKNYFGIDIRYTGFIPQGYIAGMRYDLNLLLVW